MDWNVAVERNRDALRRILAMLVTMVQVGMGRSGETSFPYESARGAERAESPSPALTLPRHLHRFVLRLLRPAEAATRRLIIIAARGLVVKLPEPRTTRPSKPKLLLNRRNGYGTGIVIRPGPLPEWARALVPKRSPGLSLSLLDPLKRFGVRRRHVKPSAMPSIRLLGDDGPIVPFFRRPEPTPPPAPPPPSPDDPLDAGRIHRRLEAIGRVLDNLPKQAQRMARWQARRDARWARERGEAADQHPVLEARNGEGVSWEELGLTPEALALCRRAESARRPAQSNISAQTAKARRFNRVSPMRPGRPPGYRKRPTHEVHELLNELHGLAVWLRDGPA